MELIKYSKDTEVGRDGLHIPSTIGQDTETKRC